MAAIGATGWTRTADRMGAPPISGVAFALLLLNLFDALCTITWVELDIAWEANPVMALALEGSPVMFMVSKMALVQAGTWLLAAHQHARAARVALGAGCALYVGIAAWHGAFVARVLIG